MSRFPSQFEPRRVVRRSRSSENDLNDSPQRGGIVVEREDGKQDTLDLSRLADRHIRSGWVRTIHSAQGATADRVMAHLESLRANTVDLCRNIEGQGCSRALHR